MEICQKLRELERLKDLLVEAEVEGEMIVDANNSNTEDPYVIFFKAEELMFEIMKGNWHSVNWKLVSMDEIKDSLLKKINNLQERFRRL
jgi:hypothetical protein